jgi:creatinine amidohydrolase
VNYIARVEDSSVLAPERGAANFAWLTRDIAESGVLGDPRAATAENGERWLQACAEKAAGAIVAAYAYENLYRP